MARRNLAEVEVKSKGDKIELHQSFLKKFKENKYYYTGIAVIMAEVFGLILEVIFLKNESASAVVLATVMCIVFSVYFMIRHNIAEYGEGNSNAFSEGLFSKEITKKDKTEQLKECVCDLFEKDGYKIDKDADLTEYAGDAVMKNKDERIVFQVLGNADKINNDVMKEMVISMWNFRADKGYLVVDEYMANDNRNVACSCNVEIWDKKAVLSKHDTEIR